MVAGSSPPPPPFLIVQISRVPYLGAAETRPKSAFSILLLSVLTPHGPKKALTGPLVFWLPPAPNSNTRSRTTGIFERSGFGIIVLGTLLRSGVAGLRTTRNSRNRPTHGSSDVPESASARDRSFAGFFPSECSHRLTMWTVWPIW